MPVLGGVGTGAGLPTGGTSGDVLVYGPAWADGAPLAQAGQTPPQEPVALGPAALVGSTGLGADAGHTHPVTGLLTVNPMPGHLRFARRRPGQYYTAVGMLTAAGVVAYPDQETATVFPVSAKADGTGQAFDRIGINVTTAQAGATAVLGVRADEGNGWPGALVFQTSALSLASTGLATATITQTLDPGLYWLVVQMTAPGSVQTTRIAAAWNGGFNSGIYPVVTGTTDIKGGVLVAGAAALPFASTAPAYNVDGSFSPAVYLRAA